VQNLRKTNSGVTTVAAKETDDTCNLREADAYQQADPAPPVKGSPPGKPSSNIRARR
jgi:hypothetical protein